jgi:hypothetical protein
MIRLTHCLNLASENLFQFIYLLNHGYYIQPWHLCRLLHWRSRLCQWNMPLFPRIYGLSNNGDITECWMKEVYNVWKNMLMTSSFLDYLTSKNRYTLSVWRKTSQNTPLSDQYWCKAQSHFFLVHTLTEGLDGLFLGLFQLDVLDSLFQPATCTFLWVWVTPSAQPIWKQLHILPLHEWTFGMWQNVSQALKRYS